MKSQSEFHQVGAELIVLLFLKLIIIELSIIKTKMKE